MILGNGFDILENMKTGSFSKVDRWTLQPEKLLLEAVRVAKELRERHYIGGRFAIDLTIGGLTRSHEDIDFYPN